MRPFAKLRGELTAREISHEDFSKGIGLCKSALSLRLNNHRQWCLDEMYASMDFLGLPYTEMSEYFPPNGKRRKEKPQ